MTDLVYLYDGSFAGFLCCIFESYAQREIPTGIYPEEDFLPTLFPTRAISTDQNHALRVYKKVTKCSPYAAELLRRGFLTCLPQKEDQLYVLDLEESLPARQMVVAYKENIPLSQAARQFIDML